MSKHGTESSRNVAKKREGTIYANFLRLERCMVFRLDARGAQVGIPRGKNPEKTTAVQKCANLVGFENDAF